MISIDIQIWFDNYQDTREDNPIHQAAWQMEMCEYPVLSNMPTNDIHTAFHFRKEYTR